MGVHSPDVDVDEFFDLVNGLGSIPGSRFRVAWADAHPADGGGDDVEQVCLADLGLSQDTAMLARIYNLLLSVVAGDDAERMRVLGPREAGREELYAPTLADIDPEKLLAVFVG